MLSLPTGSLAFRQQRYARTPFANGACEFALHRASLARSHQASFSSIFFLHQLIRIHASFYISQTLFLLNARLSSGTSLLCSQQASLCAAGKQETGYSTLRMAGGMMKAVHNQEPGTKREREMRNKKKERPREKRE